MSRGLTPRYLTAALPIQQDTGYNLPGTGDSSMPITYCHLSCVRNSFLFSTMRLWKAMINPALLCSRSIEHLKLNLTKNNIYELPHFSLSISCQSHTYKTWAKCLKFSTFQYNFVDNMSCDKCGTRRGDAAHLLFHSPAYAAPVRH